MVLNTPWLIMGSIRHVTSIGWLENLHFFQLLSKIRENVWQFTLLCKKYEKSRKKKKRYLLEKMSYEDVRHGFRKLRRPLSLKKNQHLVNTFCLISHFGKKKKILTKLLKIDPHSPINTVLGYKMGLKTRNIFLIF